MPCTPATPPWTARSAWPLFPRKVGGCALRRVFSDALRSTPSQVLYYILRRAQHGLDAFSQCDARDERNETSFFRPMSPVAVRCPWNIIPLGLEVPKSGATRVCVCVCHPWSHRDAFAFVLPQGGNEHFGRHCPTKTLPSCCDIPEGRLGNVPAFFIFRMARG